MAALTPPEILLADQNIQEAEWLLGRGATPSSIDLAPQNIQEPEWLLGVSATPSPSIWVSPIFPICGPPPPVIYNEDPADGATSVALGAPVSFDVMDMGGGVNVNVTTIILGGILAWEFDAPTVGFVGVRTGYHYTISRITGWLTSELVTVVAHVEDVVGHPADEAWSFTTQSSSVLRSRLLFVIADNAIKLIFTGNVVTSGGYNLPTGYTIVDLDGIENPIVRSVYPTEQKVINYVILEVRGLREKSRYTLTLGNNKIYDSDGRPLNDVVVKWRMRKTKVDSSLWGAARRFDKKIGSNIRGILEAIMISDEEIGGDY